MAEFSNNNIIPIGAGAPNWIQSNIEVSGVNSIRDISVRLDIDHTYTSDLTIGLFAPSGKGVILIDRRGGDGNNIKNTRFDDSADFPISMVQAPFNGNFKPEGNLSKFDGENANGIWSLRIIDSEYRDGGFLNEWSISTRDISVLTSNYTIQINFLGGLSATQMSIFTDAANRWADIITDDLTLAIDAKGEAIDGVGSILGQAGPRSVTPGTLFPNTGIMDFDTADLAAMEANGSLFNVVLHEIGHVIGIGALWPANNLVEGRGTSNPLFVGRNAMVEYGKLLGQGPTKVPAANTGGPGTIESHWRETVFGNELMTGYTDQGLLPISRLTVAMLEDMGYQVNYDAADPYVIPSQRVLSALVAASARKRKLHVSRPVCEGLPAH